MSREGSKCPCWRKAINRLVSVHNFWTLMETFASLISKEGQPSTKPLKPFCQRKWGKDTQIQKIREGLVKTCSSLQCQKGWSKENEKWTECKTRICSPGITHPAPNHNINCPSASKVNKLSPNSRNWRAPSYRGKLVRGLGRLSARS